MEIASQRLTIGSQALALPEVSLTITPRQISLFVSAAALAGMALWTRRAARRAEREHPPTGSFIEIDGTRLHYIERGQGAPLVLLHGNGATAEDFSASGVLERAAAKYRVVAFDRPGCGYSERPRGRLWPPRAQADLLGKALAHLGIQEPIVVGHSWGTLVAIALALDAPIGTRGLVLLAGYYFPGFRVDVALFSLAACPVAGALLRHTLLPLLGRVALPFAARKIFAPSPVPSRFAGFPIALSLRPSQIRATVQDTALMIPGAAALCRRYRKLAIPVTIMAGDGDRIVDSARQSKRLHDVLRGSDFRLVHGAGHMIHYVVPQEVAAAVERMAQAPGSAG